MNAASRLALRIAMLACLAGPAAAAVSVSYQGDPDLYIDTAGAGSDPRELEE